MGVDTHEHILSLIANAVQRERARCKMVVQLHQWRDGYTRVGDAHYGHYDSARMFDEIDAGYEPPEEWYIPRRTPAIDATKE